MNFSFFSILVFSGHNQLEEGGRNIDRQCFAAEHQLLLPSLVLFFLVDRSIIKLGRVSSMFVLSLRLVRLNFAAQQGVRSQRG